VYVPFALVELGLKAQVHEAVGMVLSVFLTTGSHADALFSNEVNHDFAGAEVAAVLYLLVVVGLLIEQILELQIQRIELCFGPLCLLLLLLQLKVGTPVGFPQAQQ